MKSRIKKALLLASAIAAMLGISQPAIGQMSAAQQQEFERQERRITESVIPSTQAEKDAAWADYDDLESSAARANTERREQAGQESRDRLESTKELRSAIQLVQQADRIDKEILAQREKMGWTKPYGKPNIAPTDAPLKFSSSADAANHQRLIGLLLDRFEIEMTKKREDLSLLASVHLLEEAWALGYRASDLSYALGRALTEMGDAEEAVRWLEHYLKTQRNAASEDYQLARRAYDKVQSELPAWREFHQRFEWPDKTVGEIKDRKTGLIWEVCNSFLGFWEGRWCSGHHREKTWDETMVHAMNEARRTGQPWRVPDRAELKEAASYFPEGLTGGYIWTATQSSDGRAAVLSEHMARMQRVQENGEVVPEAQLGVNAPKQQRHNFRLVR
ncbi:DUF1566 domain-containing protein [Thauera linaloolentis]|uniref:DUF1566 domain-containing protein n=1 Tax=Thauera linaloolentis (strain DSM 12138 / JCM 21573 / CCUG 41526 / CIP 105981 / IAM 15112 / NBRC 102519 / 47Lol) TaxID=1123367 RepID=N6Y5M6_THAL4|nr:DUF1566 domain-containing protein [Thauera linaloolentis]ENO89511.1 hypothetical protein C666_05645 [Thauera linaloolentis 47Lol = DSM 12138]MCM8565406.1 DUF1566 domain-containing protein [Thauera linaloolentis]